MKIISFTVPCYNSAGYMEKCVESLLCGGSDVEIILVDDGSNDDTAKIADSYAARYPNVVKTIHQENGGHGEAVNTGLANATGLYFKVVDSDDWLDAPELRQVLDKLRAVHSAGTVIDMMVCNYVYEHMVDGSSFIMQYRSTLPQNRIFGWADLGKFKISEYILMHSVIYRRELLQECGLRLPKHTFYVDHLFVYQPLPFVKTLYYMDVNLYRYLIGRADQSVNEQTMIRRIDQQIRVNKLMIMAPELNMVADKRLRKYMINYLSMVTTATNVFCILSKSKENLKKKNELWDFLHSRDKKLYKRLRYNLFGIFTNLPGHAGRKITTGLYRIARKIYKFN